jgi:hypothetical protein
LPQWLQWPYLPAWLVHSGDVAGVSDPPSTVPEPGTLSIVLAGLGLLGGFAYRRKSQVGQLWHIEAGIVERRQCQA